MWDFIVRMISLPSPTMATITALRWSIHKPTTLFISLLLRWSRRAGLDLHPHPPSGLLGTPLRGRAHRSRVLLGAPAASEGKPKPSAPWPRPSPCSGDSPGLPRGSGNASSILAHSGQDGRSALPANRPAREWEQA